jgi:hypothetical protein
MQLDGHTLALAYGILGGATPSLAPGVYFRLLLIGFFEDDPQNSPTLLLLGFGAVNHTVGRNIRVPIKPARVAFLF